jgi:hypothetical protein
LSYFDKTNKNGGLVKSILVVLFVVALSTYNFAQAPQGQLIQGAGVTFNGSILKVENTDANTYVMGVQGVSLTTGSAGIVGDGGSFGVKGFCQTGSTTSRYGFYGVASGGTNAYGVYGKASGASSGNWGGYFIGNTYCSAGIWSGSDERLKKDITGLEPVLGKISKLNPIRYKYDSKVLAGLPDESRIGLSAQNIQEVFPECVKDVDVPVVDNHGQIVSDTKGNQITKSYKAVNYEGLIPVLLSAIQEQQKEIEELKLLIKK